ncbi:hypothetical protein ACIA74_30205 [Streptomyces sp. NPDC051658]|uniref:hypothetical protein n=1 Tax=Streptomyces sp. NPDC051658 TaxID=3365667 RepID=UPI0037914AEF
MYFDPWSPEPFLQALLEALPDGWSGTCTKPYPEGGEYEDVRITLPTEPRGLNVEPRALDVELSFFSAGVAQA